ncbi:Htur_1727 family rSAM-partnered candidate RiPP [Halobellus sp. GM3]|uniref:Htur_1727 family rSAM-partnered candidate RiPP n=1 Tax=Halobellus sp. GM3 TaxID=3458410 RepID=UPI00403DB476
MTGPYEMRVTEPRSDATPEWEVFLRTDESEPLRHVGSVTAPSASVAREQASTLFGWTARTLWLCRADDVDRFTNRDLGSDAVGGDTDDVAAAATVDGGDAP